MTDLCLLVLCLGIDARMCHVVSFHKKWFNLIIYLTSLGLDWVLTSVALSVFPECSIDLHWSLLHNGCLLSAHSPTQQIQTSLQTLFT